MVSVHEGQVTFTYRDRRDQNKKKQMILDAVEFIRRFLLHVLPDGFVKIRYYGFLYHRHKRRCVALIRGLINPDRVYPEKVNETIAAIIKRLTGRDITCCPQLGP
ncbi:MAG: transposase [Thermodesulfobacteriota bacterium]